MTHFDDDSRLLADFIETGDAALFGELYLRYMPLVYGLCLKYLGNVEDAEDAVMQLFEELTSKLGNYRIKNFRTWLWSVARNHCLQIIRRQKRAVKIEFDEQTAERFMESTPIVHLLSEGVVSGDISDEEALSALEGCMKKLPEKQRETISMFFFDKRSYAEIADVTLYDIKGVKSYIQNGKRSLRICLERQGIEL